MARQSTASPARAKGPTPKGPTPKGTGPKAAAGRANRRYTPKAGKAGPPAADPTGRYTPPVPRSKRVSRPWVGVLLLVLLGAGALVIVLDYLGVLPGGTSGWYLLAGLVLVAVGFGVATQYR